ncbi:nucleoside triphosphate pyrophosphohydrolase [Crocosphaera sp.]|uniref:nucleoside triphosphate pyrophosphohydrolase n=1 Tax=Crocosphaera sp. TaxID=2729996 RepID=UPI003F24BE80|nr:nucleoside triphosphate pyrophosphohydrolase [Crocosphaera sp.]
MSDFKATQPQTYHAILEALNHLINVVAKLRSPDGGCPWDLAQTPQTLIPYVIEEAYEVVHAIRSENQTAIVEELGDLLLQVVLQSQIAQDNGDFSLQEVAEGITNKLIRRHPHVFGDVTVENSEEVRQNWDKIKAQEKGEKLEMAQLLSRKLDRYHRTLPPLMASSKISVKAAKAGFEWENIDGVWGKFSEELTEFKESLESGDKVHQQSELGDLLFTIVNIARWYDLDASEALSGTNERFIQRLSIMEKFAESPLTDYSLEELEKLWQKAKKELNQ